MSERHEEMLDLDIRYCLVDFKPEHPRVYVVPSVVIADGIKNEHRFWLATSGKNGRPHKETKIRRIRQKQVGMPEGWLIEYLEAWEQFT